MIRIERGYITLKGNEVEIMADLTCIMKMLKDRGMERIVDIAYSHYDYTEEEWNEELSNMQGMAESFNGMVNTIKLLTGMSEEEREKLRKKLEEN